MSKLNVEVLKEYFADAGFSVKELDVGDDGICRIEWNYPDDPRGIAMRTAFAKNGADVCTYYQYRALTEVRGELLTRERALIPFGADADLRAFFNNVMDDYTKLFDDVGLNPQGTGQQFRGSSYHVDSSRVRRPLSGG